MPTARVTANTSAQTLFSTPEHVKGKITVFKVDNQGSTAKTIELQDVFTPDASVGTSSPTEQTIYRLQITVGAGLTADVPETELRDVEFLGTAKAVASGVDTNCKIIVGYHFE